MEPTIRRRVRSETSTREVARTARTQEQASSTISMYRSHGRRRAYAWMPLVLSLSTLALEGCGSAPDLPPPSEEDVLRSFIESPWLPDSRFTLLGVLSDCETKGANKTGVSADLYHAFLLANGKGGSALDLAALTSRSNIVVGAAGGGPEVVRARTGRPVITLSRVGIWNDRAVVCVRLYAQEPAAYLITLARTGPRDWALQNQFVAWEPEPPLGPDEFAPDPE